MAHCCCTCFECLQGSTTKDSGSEMKSQRMYCPDSGLLWNGKKDSDWAKKTVSKVGVLYMNGGNFKRNQHQNYYNILTNCKFEYN